MTTERFYETLKYIVELDRNLRLQTGIEAIANNLAALVQSPNQPPTQQALATALEALDAADSSLREELKPSDQEAIREVGGAEFFDPALAASIHASISTNAMTPTVARDYVQGISTRRAAFLATVKQTISGLDELGVVGREAVAGDADVTFVVPRELFDNKLEKFAKELIFFSRLVEHISEATTGKAEAAILETLSSSTPTVGIFAAVGVISMIATAVNGFLDAWKKVQDFRNTRARLKELGISGKALQEVDERIITIVDEVVETTTTTILLHYPGNDSGRKNELAAAIRQDAHRLFGQIERGLVVQFRAEAAPEESDPAAKAALTNIDRVGRTLTYPTVDTAPLLLSSAEIIEGDIKVSTTTKTTRRTSKKKTVDKGG
jgi:hypothetical protein